MPEDYKPDLNDFFEKAAEDYPVSFVFSPLRHVSGSCAFPRSHYLTPIPPSRNAPNGASRVVIRQDASQGVNYWYEQYALIMLDFALESIRSVPPIISTSVVHDNACGPGVVSGQIIHQYKSGEVLPEIYATDFSEAMIRVLHKKPWADKVTTEVMDARDLKFPDDKFSHSFTNFALMALAREDAVKAAGQLYRTLKPGGTAAVTTWKKLGYMVVFHDAQESVKPDAELKPGPLPAEWMTESMLRDVLHEGGFKDVQIHTKRESIDSATWVDSLALMKGMVVNHITAGWTEDEKKAYNKSLDRQYERERKHPRSLDMVAFVAVGKK